MATLDRVCRTAGYPKTIRVDQGSEFVSRDMDLWAVTRDDRGWGGGDPPAVVFTYASGRHGRHAMDILRGFEGILQVDGYTGYDALAEPKRVGGMPLTLAYCWAHSRRKLHDIYQKDGSEIAAEGLRRIAQIYKVEASVRGRPPEERLAARQVQSAPLITDFRLWLTQQRSRISAKSRLGEKLGYIHRHWDGLQIFLTDGRVEMDTNPVENTIRPIAKRGSLCCPSSSICKHWKCACIDGATRACFSGYSTFDRLRGEVFGSDLIGGAGDHLNRRQYAGFDKVPYPVVCNA